MSTPKPARTYLVLAAILLATTVVAAGAAAYYYSQFTSQQSTNSNLVSKAATLNSDLATRDAQIADLQQKLAHAQSELQGNLTLVASLQTQLNNLKAADVIVAFKDIITPATISGCGFLGLQPCPGSGTLTAVAWANLGTTEATMAKLTLNFYSGPGGTGMVLCSVDQSLGTMGVVAGQSVDALGGLSNSCSTGFSTAMSVTSKVTWSTLT